MLLPSLCRRLLTICIKFCRATCKVSPRLLSETHIKFRAHWTVCSQLGYLNLSIQAQVFLRFFRLLFIIVYLLRVQKLIQVNETYWLTRQYTHMCQALSKSTQSLRKQPDKFYFNIIQTELKSIWHVRDYCRYIIESLIDIGHVTLHRLFFEAPVKQQSPKVSSRYSVVFDTPHTVGSLQHN